MYFEREYLRALIKSLDVKGVFLVHRKRNETIFNKPSGYKKLSKRTFSHSVFQPTFMEHWLCARLWE